MKVLLVNGSPRVDGNTALALAEMDKIFAEEGIETTTIQVGMQAIRGCIACGKCGELGKCIFDDAVNEYAKLFEECDECVEEIAQQATSTFCSPFPVIYRTG